MVIIYKVLSDNPGGFFGFTGFNRIREFETSCFIKWTRRTPPGKNWLQKKN